MTYLLKTYDTPQRKIDNMIDVWERHHFYVTGLFTETIHHREDHSKNEINKCISQRNITYGEFQLENSKYTARMDLFFNLTYLINLFLFILPLTDIFIILTYTQYTSQIRSYISNIGRIYRQYNEASLHYNNLNKELSKYAKREYVNPINNFNTISINHLKYFYPQGSPKITKIIDMEIETQVNPFGIVLQNPIVLTGGNIVRLDGESGHGKSTFLDILCGIIPYNKIQSSIFYDDIDYGYGFNSIEKVRLYVEQSENINYSPSVYEIITCNYDDLSDTKLVYKALEMAECADFIELDNTNNNRMSIFTKLNDNKPSGGQKGRISIARAIYRAIKTIPKIIVLDEIDKAVQASMAIKILGNIFNYCRENKIICVVAAHSTEIKQLEYDQVIKFKKNSDGYATFWV